MVIAVHVLTPNALYDRETVKIGTETIVAVRGGTLPDAFLAVVRFDRAFVHDWQAEIQAHSDTSFVCISRCYHGSRDETKEPRRTKADGH